jgi:CysZ protein
MHDLISGFLLPFRGIKLLNQPGVRRYVALPLALNILILSLILWISARYFGTFIDAFLPENSWWDFARPVLWAVFSLAYLLTLFYGFTLCANLAAAPFNAMLSAKIEEHLTGQPSPISHTPLLMLIRDTLSSELNKLGYFISRSIPLWLLLIVAIFIPGLNLLVSLLWITFGFWFLALEYTDYPMGNHEIKPKTQRQINAQRRAKSLAFGAGVSLLLFIPFIGFIAMPSAVAGATRYWVDDLKNNRTHSTQ